MRLQRGEVVAGLPSELARQLARSCHAAWTNTERIAAVCKITKSDAAAALESLLAAGYVDRRTIGDAAGGRVQWDTTVKGAALAMASFAAPISRGKAQQLLHAVLHRIDEYNADDGKPYLVTSLRVFGSFLDPLVDKLGDLDLDVEFEPRTPEAEETEAKLDYADRSGRRFSTFMDRLFWPQVELLQILRGRSAYINVHTGDVERLGVRFEVAYPRPLTDD
jgi:predicted nucleotidyltransferase